MRVMLRPRVNATNRTKHRIKVHGPEFILLKDNNNRHRNNEILVENAKWIGWLPKAEIILEEIK